MLESNGECLIQKAISVANATKAQGNTLYAAGKFSEALDCYGSALEGVANDPNANELRAQCYSNRAICEIKLVMDVLNKNLELLNEFSTCLTNCFVFQQNYAAAVTESTKALELDPKYVKALIRRSDANENLKKFEEALSGMCPCSYLHPKRG